MQIPLEGFVLIVTQFCAKTSHCSSLICPRSFSFRRHPLLLETDPVAVHLPIASTVAASLDPVLLLHASSQTSPMSRCTSSTWTPPAPPWSRTSRWLRASKPRNCPGGTNGLLRAELRRLRDRAEDLLRALVREYASRRPHALGLLP
ncbi:hypothetical protein VPH35_059136 [Triticum aestivum]|uniref:Uncharacterized protein n=7 Tax=Aegilops tauschii subsp. strangulata TaxID=200361 RepID=A0A453EHZ5_AEGTS